MLHREIAIKEPIPALVGQGPGIIRRFGGAEKLQETLDEVQQRLYAA